MPRPFEQLDYCARWGGEVVHFSEIGLIGGLDRAHLRRIRSHTEAPGLELEMGMRSIAPGSTIFDPGPGSAEDQLTAVLEAARIGGSPLVRCVVGRFVDPTRPGGIERRIEEGPAQRPHARASRDAGAVRGPDSTRALTPGRARPLPWTLHLDPAATKMDREGIL